jgi:GT2 family glycosyltransferase/glycosyltransferase involved in cell wall biosynthesis
MLTSRLGRTQSGLGRWLQRSRYEAATAHILSRTVNLVDVGILYRRAIRQGGGILLLSIKSCRILRREGLAGIKIRTEMIATQRADERLLVELFLKKIREAGGIVRFVAKSWRIFLKEGWQGLDHRARSLKASVSAFSATTARVSVAEALVNTQRWCTPEKPEVSILIINWNATQLTLECLRQVWGHTKDISYEVIVADNGSRAGSMLPLKKTGRGTRLLELGSNRFFGEANNIAAESATGKYLCFLNNDAFVQSGWLRSLVDHLEKTPDAGVVGPMFLFPDQRLQEAGCAIDENGFPTRYGRNRDAALPEFNVPKSVDYVSAAAMLIERRLFTEAGGFDLAYEPAYYEDVDLCFKVRALGRNTWYCPSAKVIHAEGMSSDLDEDARATRQYWGDLNRSKFTERWGHYLKTRSEDDLAQHWVNAATEPAQNKNAATLSPPSRESATEHVAIFTPYSLTPGGGERYILTLAAALADKRRVTLVTAHPYSRMRLLSMAREFDLDLSSCASTTYQSFAAGPPADFMFTLGNHVVPAIPAHAKNSWYQCQFPFPISAEEFKRCRNFLDGYRGINVYSNYAKSFTARALTANNLPSLPIEVVYPPVSMIGGDASRKKNIILSVGRFFTGGHSKRQDLLIEAFRNLRQEVVGEVELHLAGSSVPDLVHMTYLSELYKTAKGLPVEFHVNPTREVLWQLYRDAAIYWHATGLHSDLEREPEKAEHFGISIVEAMSAETVPFAFNAGGPREIITHGVDGFLYETEGALVELTAQLLHESGAVQRIEMGRAAGKTAERHKVESFVAKMRQLVDTAKMPAEHE